MYIRLFLGKKKYIYISLGKITFLTNTIGKSIYWYYYVQGTELSALYTLFQFLTAMLL